MGIALKNSTTISIATCLVIILALLAAGLHPSFRFDTLKNLELIPAEKADKVWETRGPQANIEIKDNIVSLIRNMPGYTGAKALVSLSSKTPNPKPNEALLSISANFERLAMTRPDLSAPTATDNTKGVLAINWLNQNKELIRVKIVANLSELLEKGSVTTVFAIPAEAKFASVGLLLRREAESVAMDDLTIRLVQHSSSYVILIAFLATFFCALIAYIFLHFVRTAGLMLPTIVALGSGLVIVATGISSDYLNLLIAKLAVFWPDLMEIDHSSQMLLRLLVHISLFFGLSSLVFAVFKTFRKSLLTPFLLLTLVAIGTELVQAHLLTRSADFVDLLADFTGILLVFFPVFCTYLITSFVGNRK